MTTIEQIRALVIQIKRHISPSVQQEYIAEIIALCDNTMAEQPGIEHLRMPDGSIGEPPQRSERDKAIEAELQKTLDDTGIAVPEHPRVRVYRCFSTHDIINVYGRGCDEVWQDGKFLPDVVPIPEGSMQGQWKMAPTERDKWLAVHTKPGADQPSQNAGNLPYARIEVEAQVENLQRRVEALEKRPAISLDDLPLVKDADSVLKAKERMARRPTRPTSTGLPREDEV